MLFSPEGRPDRRPSIVICAYDQDSEIWDPYQDLSGVTWDPPGARTVVAGADAPEALAPALIDLLNDPDCRAVLLVGRSHSAGKFRVQMRAENRGVNGARLSLVGPSVARATAPVAEMVRTLKDAGLEAEASSHEEEEDTAGGFLLYSLLTSLDDNVEAPAIGLMRVPLGATDRDANAGVRAAAAAMALHLSPLPRSHG